MSLRDGRLRIGTLLVPPWYYALALHAPPGATLMMHCYWTVVLHWFCAATVLAQQCQRNARLVAAQSRSSTSEYSASKVPAQNQYNRTSGIRHNTMRVHWYCAGARQVVHW